MTHVVCQPEYLRRPNKICIYTHGAVAYPVGIYRPDQIQGISFVYLIDRHTTISDHT